MKRGLFLIVLLSSICVASGQEADKVLPAPDEAAKLTALFRKQAHEMMKGYEFTLPEHRDIEVRFHSKPLMTWTNPIAGNWEGVVYMWTAEGRPAVIGSPLHHSDRRKMAHHFHQLIDQPLTGLRYGTLVWQTDQSGVTWKPLLDSEEPKTSMVARSLQLRGFARKFSVKKVFQNSIQRDLRLLPKFIFRNEIVEGREVLDGACFVFTQSTDPNVVLLFEARKTDNGPKWFYALARLNQFELIVSYEKKEVWRFPFVPFKNRSDPRVPYTKFFNQLYKDL